MQCNVFRRSGCVHGPIVQLVEQAYGSRIGSTRGRGGVHRAGAGEPAPLRGAACVLRRRSRLRRSRRAVRLHPVVDGGPGTPIPGRGAGAVHPAAQARSAARHGTGQGPRPRPGDRAAPRRPVHLRDLRAAREREHPAQPHRRGRDPHRGGIRAAAATPRAAGQHQPGHLRARHPAAAHRAAGLRILARHSGNRQGRVAAADPRPDRAAPTRSGAQGRLSRHPGGARDLLVVVAAGAETDPHPPGLPRR